MTVFTRFDELSLGDEITGRTYTCDNVQLMLYNASLWNGHRIHYDHPYATEVEGYSGLVIAGPLIGDWLSQCVMEWIGDAGELKRFSYSNRAASYVGETFTSGAKVVAFDRQSLSVELELFVRNGQSEIVAPGSAIVQLPQASTTPRSPR